LLPSDVDVHRPSAISLFVKERILLVTCNTCYHIECRRIASVIWERTLVIEVRISYLCVSEKKA
ncbi:hypothetical protein COCMIDRAFT_110839, partial [Bipolaris oryzae ATCC 44560]